MTLQTVRVPDHAARSSSSTSTVIISMSLTSYTSRPTLDAHRICFLSSLLDYTCRGVEKCDPYVRLHVSVRAKRESNGHHAVRRLFATKVNVYVTFCVFLNTKMEENGVHSRQLFAPTGAGCPESYIVLDGSSMCDE